MTATAQKVWLNNQPSVADRLAFDDLPDSMKASIVRLYGHDFRDGEPEGGVEPAAASLKDAFEAGWEACAEAIEHPYFEERAFDWWQKRRKKEAA